MTVDVFSAKRLERQVRIDPKATGIVVIDMLNEFCKAGGAMVLPGYERLIRPKRRSSTPDATPVVPSCSWSTRTAGTYARTANFSSAPRTASRGAEIGRASCRER